MVTVIIFLIVLAVLIFVHELGHFLIARACGIRVDAFKIGFGPKLFAWKRGGTEYGVNLIPFGGYVKIFGESLDDDSIKGPESHRSIATKPRWQQIAVLAGGVSFNIIFAAILYIGLFAGGVTASPDGFQDYSAYFSDPRVMITDVSKGSPAEKAGLMVGDVIKVDSIEMIQTNINASAGMPIAFQYVRGGLATTTEVVPITGIVEGRYAIGIAMSDVVDIHLPFFTAVYEGVNYTGHMIKDTVVGLYTFFGGIFHGTSKLSDVSGPVGIAGFVGDAAHLGFTYLLMITALISINLAVINIVPFPALDGGRILFVLIESVIRRRISSNFTNIVNTVGFILLMILIVLITGSDVLKWFK